MGQAPYAPRWTVELRADQLLGLPGNAFLEPAVQPVRLQLLRSLDPAVKTHLTRRPLRRLVKRALPIASRCTYPPSNGLPTTRCTLGDDARIPEKLPKSSVTLGKWRRCARCNQRAP